MSLTFRIEYRGIVGMRQGEFRNRYLKPMYEDMAAMWVGQFLPRHFTVAGGREYGYAERTKKYMLRKAKTKHHQRPLVWSGELEAKAGYAYKVKHAKGEARIVLPGARKANFRPKGSHVNMREEIETVLPREAQALVARGNAFLTEGLRYVPDVKIKRVG